MKTERLKCPNCGSNEIQITAISEININCLFSFEFICQNCGHEGKISINNERNGKVEIVYT